MASSGNPKHRARGFSVSRAGGVAAVAAAAVALCVMPGGAVAAAGALVDTADEGECCDERGRGKSYDFKAWRVSRRWVSF